MSNSNFHIKGTTNPSFQIGANGPTIRQATTTPNGTDGVDGDIWIVTNGAGSGIYQKMASTWTIVSSNSIGQLADLVPVLNDFIVGDGTAWTTANGTSAQSALGLSIGADVQAWSANLDNLAALSQNIGEFIVSDGANWTTQSGSTVRTSLGLGTSDSVSFKDLTVENGNILQGKAGLGVTSGQYVIYNTTTDNTTTELFIDGSSQRLVLNDLTSWCFDIQMLARRTDALGEMTGFIISGCIDRNTGAATTAIIGGESIEGNEGQTNWSVAVDADTINGSLRITVTGEAGKTIKWVSFVRTVEVTV